MHETRELEKLRTAARLLAETEAGLGELRPELRTPEIMRLTEVATLARARVITMITDRLSSPGE